LVVTVGLTTAKLLLMAPGFQVYVVATVDVAVIVEVPPIQILGELGVSVSDGPGSTVIVGVTVKPKQPLALAPTTVYIVVAAGVKVTNAPEIFPGVQV
jgi:hypothetical protein